MLFAGNNVSLSLAIIATTTLVALLLWSPRLSRNNTWRASITPLASIIGSGFLVLGPILEAAYGLYAPLVMAALCVFAYLLGGAIRFNIAAIERERGKPLPLVAGLETAASWALGFAYIISVSYYLNLFGAFGVSLTDINDAVHAKMLTTAVFAVIVFVGWTRGFKMLEHLEYVSVTAKLAIIAGLIVGLAAFSWAKNQNGGLLLNAPTKSGWAALTLAFGLIVTVQGFETSRYLGAEYDGETRIRSMRLAQWTAAVIYLIYVVLVSYAFDRGQLHLTETTIVQMMQVVAPVLPPLLVAAAMAAQFSAAIADTGGSGGLFSELTRHRVSERASYLLLSTIGLLLTWTSDVFEIISYASRAFAIYYALQAAIAAVRSWSASRTGWRGYAFAALALFTLAAALFGTPMQV